LVAAAQRSPKHPEGSGKVVNALAVAVGYDGCRSRSTCEVIEERWVNWFQHDPVRAIESHADNLRGLKAIYIDCGSNDQFNLLYGARRLVRRLNELGIARRYKEFPTTTPVLITG
jgi:hypothetical protein